MTRTAVALLVASVSALWVRPIDSFCGNVPWLRPLAPFQGSLVSLSPPRRRAGVAHVVRAAVGGDLDRSPEHVLSPVQVAFNEALVDGAKGLLDAFYRENDIARFYTLEKVPTPPRARRARVVF